MTISFVYAFTCIFDLISLHRIKQTLSKHEKDTNCDSQGYLANRRLLCVQQIFYFATFIFYLSVLLTLAVAPDIFDDTHHETTRECRLFKG